MAILKNFAVSVGLMGEPSLRSVPRQGREGVCLILPNSGDLKNLRILPILACLFLPGFLELVYPQVSPQLD